MIYLCRENSDAQEGSLHLTLSKPTKGNCMGFFCIYITTIYLNVRYCIVLHGTSTLLFDDYDNVIAYFVIRYYYIMLYYIIKSY